MRREVEQINDFDKASLVMAFVVFMVVILFGG
jgi:hypothetical protein